MIRLVTGTAYAIQRKNANRFYTKTGRWSELPRARLYAKRCHAQVTIDFQGLDAVIVAVSLSATIESPRTAKDVALEEKARIAAMEARALTMVSSAENEAPVAMLSPDWRALPAQCQPNGEPEVTVKPSAEKPAPQADVTAQETPTRAERHIDSSVANPQSWRPAWDVMIDDEAFGD